MVDFTRPINNGDMVRGLNHLVQRNLDMLAVLDKVDDELAASTDRSGAIPELKQMHRQHVDRVADTIRVLGGAPARETDSHQWVGQSKIVLSKLRDDRATLSAIRSEEGKLREEYHDQLQALKASPEAVEVIRTLLEDEDRQLQKLNALANPEDQ